MAAHCCWKRMTISFILFYAVFSSFPSMKANGKRIKDKIYIDLSAQNACFRLLNGTHQIGCTSDMSGNTGVIYYMKTPAAWDVVLKTGNAQPYAAILDASDFTSENVRRLTGSGRVNGILVLSVNLTSKMLPAGFSSDLSCPNDGSGLNPGCGHTWNPTGAGLKFDDLSIPVFSVTSQADVDNLLDKCWTPYNKPAGGEERSYPLCAVQLSTFMEAAKDSETCIRRSQLQVNLNPDKVCDPLGDNNVIASLKALAGTAPARDPGSLIVVATRVDAFGMFLNEFVSADTSVTGIVALLATAQALWKLKSTIMNEKDSKDILLAFFQGEAFDYIGSSRMVYDMQRDAFPQNKEDSASLKRIKLEHVDLFVELNQVGLSQDDSLWMHADPDVYSKRKEQMDATLKKMVDFGNSSSVIFSPADHTLPLPPASLQRFLREADKSKPPLSFVVTDHNRQFSNKYYNSRLDLPATIQADYPANTTDPDQQYNTSTPQSMRLTSLATALARYLFWAATGRDPTDEESKLLVADRMEVNHMLYCFMHSPHCELFNFTIDPDNAGNLAKNNKPFPFFVTVSRERNWVTRFIQRVLAYYTGSVANVTQDGCQGNKRYSLLWMQGAKQDKGGRKNVCYNSSVHLTTAESPAFDISDYDWGSGMYSTWTESVWANNFISRVFLIPSKQFETSVLSAGVIMLVLSLLVVYWIHDRADILFHRATMSREYLFEYST